MILCSELSNVIFGVISLLGCCGVLRISWLGTMGT
jgi:hypothetical protein